MSQAVSSASACLFAGRKFLSLAIVALLATLVLSPGRAQAETISINEGEGLYWGMKQSWRGYAGIGTVSEGVTVVNGQDGYHWPFVSGTYDDQNHHAELQFAGKVRWEAHEGALDVTFSNPKLIVDGDDSQLLVTALSKSESTGEMRDYGEVAVVDVILEEEDLTLESGATTWTGLQTLLTATGREIFSGNYPTGTTMDPIRTSYVGPGGFPQPTKDDFRVEGSLAFAENLNYTATERHYSFHYDPVNELIHSVVADNGLIASDPETLETVGEPLGENTNSFANNYPRSVFDPATQTVFDARQSDIYAFTWDDDAGEYSSQVIAAGMSPDALYFDTAGDRLFAVDDSALASWSSDGSGGWEKTAYSTVGVPINAASRAKLAVDDNGEMVIVADASREPRRVRLNGATATVSILPDDYTDPDALQPGQYDQPSSVQPIPGQEGGFYLTNYRGVVYEVREDGSGELRLAGEPLEVGYGAVLETELDRENGRFLLIDYAVGKIGIIENGEFVGEIYAGGQIGSGVLSPIGVGVGPGGSIFVNRQLNQYRYDPVAYSPRIDQAPVDVTLPLARGELSGIVTFDAAASADPAGDLDPTPSVRWQYRHGSAGKFTDIEGASGSSLELTVGPESNGGQVRAIFTNPAGEVGTEPATITVNTAADIGAQPSDVSVNVGETAEFKVFPTGNPAPEITWQRRVAGFWQNIEPESTDFEIDGGFLDVLDVNEQMDGTSFRARLRNRIDPGSDEWSTVHTRSVTLRVVKPVSEPVTFGSGSLDWGFANRWRCYVVGTVARGGIEVSGGIERIPGTEASGSLCPTAGAGSEALRFPVKGGSYDPVSGALEVRMGGTVRFWGHDYHVPGDTTPQLDTTFSNLRLVAQGSTGTLIADTSGATMDDPNLVERRDVPLVSLDLNGSGPVADGETGLSWVNAPSTLTAAGAEVFGSYPENEPFDPVSMSLVFGEPQTDEDPDPTTDDGKVKAKIKRGKKVQLLGGKRLVRLGQITCPAGADRCKVTVRKKVPVKIGGRKFKLRVMAPKRLAGGKKAVVKVRFGRNATDRLAGKRTRVKVRVTVSTGKSRTARSLRVTVRGR